jgi:hypothetical protein
MPMLAVVWHSWPLNSSGWARTDSRLRATSSISLVSEVPRRMTTNSSPPSRAITSQARRLLRSLLAQAIAGFVTQRIIDDLESVEIDEQHRKPPIVASRGLDREMHELLNITRLSNSVRLSWVARYSICRSARAFSSAWSKFASANETLSASRCSRSINSGVNVPIWVE